MLWTLIYLIIPLTMFGYGVQYSNNGARCPVVGTMYAGLIGTGVCEGILLFGIFGIVYLHWTDSGNTVHIDTTITTYSDGRQTRETSRWTWRGNAYCFTGLMILLSARFFLPFIKYLLYKTKYSLLVLAHPHIVHNNYTEPPLD